jgi:hypothetical protein
MIGDSALKREPGDGNDHATFDTSLLRIPKRPAWNKEMSKEQLDANEKRSFLEWRRQLSLFEESLPTSSSSIMASSSTGASASLTSQQITMTPYERNLEV